MGSVTTSTPLSSAEYIKDRTLRAACLVAATALAGFFLTVAGVAALRDATPIHLTITNAEVQGKSLVVNLESDVNAACIRITSHALYSRDASGRTSVWPLALGLTGLNKTVGVPEKFRVVLPLSESVMNNDKGPGSDEHFYATPR